MKFSVPTIDSLKTEGINAGGLMIGVIGGYALQQFLMKERTSKDGTTKPAIIKDNIVFNAIGTVAGIALAATATSPFVKFIGLGIATIFAIRTVNRATDKLSGLGNLNGGLKSFLETYVPSLKGIGADAWDYPMGNLDYMNEPTMLPMSGHEEFGRTTAMKLAEPFPASQTSERAGRHA